MEKGVIGNLGILGFLRIGDFWVQNEFGGNNKARLVYFICVKTLTIDRRYVGGLGLYLRWTGPVVLLSGLG